VLDHFGVIPDAWDRRTIGSLGVQCFFAMSGWLIGGILLRSDRSSLPKFFFGRVTRIWIPYFAALVLLYGSSLIKEGPEAFLRWWPFLVFDSTFTRWWFAEYPSLAMADSLMPFRGTGWHFWSISVEEQFYLAAPLIITLVRYGRSPLLWGLTAAVLTLTQSGFAAVAVGVFAATLQQEFPYWYLRPMATVLIAAATALCAVLLFGLHAKLMYPLVGCGVMLLSAIPGPRFAFAEFVGGISYPLYLNHWIGLFVAASIVKRGSLPGDWQGPLGYVLAVIVAALLYVAIDRVVMRHRSTFYTERVGRWCTVGAYVNMAAGVVFGVILFALR